MWKHTVWIAGIAPLLVLAAAIAGCGERQPLAPDESAALAEPVRSNAATDVGPSRDDGEDDRGEERSAQPITGPATISSPGNYRLTGGFDTAQGDGIVITASHVRLWLGDYRLSGPGNKLGRAIVIDGAADVQVTGGRIEHFGIGAALINASRCRVRGLEVQGGDETADPGAGNPPQIGIMLVNSTVNAISDNELTRVNLGIFVRGGASYANRISGNEVVGGNHGLLGICYNPAPGGDPAGPHADRVTRNLLARFGTGIATSAQSAENLFARNTIRYFTAAYQDLNGTNVFVRNRTAQITP